jgi:hypothetical protein
MLDIIAYAYDYKARHLKEFLKKENLGSLRSQLECWNIGIMGWRTCETWANKRPRRKEA